MGRGGRGKGGGAPDRAGPASPLYLRYISPISPLYLPYISQAREVELAEEAAAAGGGSRYRAAARGSAAHAQLRLHAMLQLKLSRGELTGKAMQMLNLAEEWLSTFLPHCLQKIDRVSFGLLSAAEVVKLQKLDPHTPRSRLKLAIPFLGKDVPSTASEFAHPDIIIGLTVLAYRWEAMPTLPLP